MQLFGVECGKVAAVNQHAAGSGCNLAGNQAQQGSFTTAGTTHHGGKRALGYLKTNVVQDGAFAIGKGDVLHFDEGCSHRRQRLGLHTRVSIIGKKRTGFNDFANGEAECWLEVL